MILLVLTFLFLIIAILGPRFIKDRETHRGTMALGWARWTARGLCVVLAFIFFSLTSILYIDSEEVGHMKKIYGGSNMPASQVLAAPWQKGAQARVLTPGFKFMPFVKVFYDIEKKALVTIPEGSYGFLIAKDGAPLRSGQYLADAWEPKDFQKMIDAEFFLGFEKGEDEYTGSRGQKGPQLSVLRPGQYRINRYLFDIKEGKSTDVEAGFVGVVKSNVGDDYTGSPILPTGVDASALSVPIVPKGNQGVWKEVLKPGRYYMNEKAYKITSVDTRVQTLKYIGGYTRRWVDLKIGDNGTIEQSERTDDVPYDAENYADRAIILRVEGWDVFQDSRVQVQVTPANAPFIVAAVGSMIAVEDKILTPNFRSILRNVVAQDQTIDVQDIDAEGKPMFETDGKTPVMTTKERPRKVLDLLYEREEIEDAVLSRMKPAASKAGITVQWVRLGDPAIPPELLIPGKRKQLANQLKMTYEQEKLAQQSRVDTEKERARADQQGTLMKSKIGIEVADNNKAARIKAGEAEKAYLALIAEGQEAQALVLGKEKAFELAYIEKILDAAVKNPKIVKMPTTMVSGTNGGFEGAAAILGANNMTMGLPKPTTPEVKK